MSRSTSTTALIFWYYFTVKWTQQTEYSTKKHLVDAEMVSTEHQTDADEITKCSTHCVISHSCLGVIQRSTNVFFPNVFCLIIKSLDGFIYNKLPSIFPNYNNTKFGRHLVNVPLHCFQFIWSIALRTKSPSHILLCCLKWNLHEHNFLFFNWDFTIVVLHIILIGPTLKITYLQIKPTV